MKPQSKLQTAKQLRWASLVGHTFECWPCIVVPGGGNNVWNSTGRWLESALYLGSSQTSPLQPHWLKLGLFISPILQMRKQALRVTQLPSGWSRFPLSQVWLLLYARHDSASRKTKQTKQTNPSAECFSIFFNPLCFSHPHLLGEPCFLAVTFYCISTHHST